MTRAAYEMLLWVPAERAPLVGTDGQEGRDRAADVHEDERIVPVRRPIGRPTRHLVQARDGDEPLASQPRHGRVACREHAQKGELERLAATRHWGFIEGGRP